MKNDLLEANDFVLLEYGTDNWYILRIITAVPIDITYFPETEISGFQALAPFGSPAQYPYQSFYVNDIQLSMQEFTNITNILEPNNMGWDRKNWLLQIFTGISPSYVKLYKYYPSNVPLGNFLANGKVHWGGRELNFQIDGVDGFDSPFDAPSPKSEFFLPPTQAYEIALVNMSSIPATPVIKLRINQMIVEPVSSVSLASKILDRVVPAKIATVGAFDSRETPPVGMYGIKPVKLNASTAQLTDAGYGGA